MLKNRDGNGWSIAGILIVVLATIAIAVVGYTAKRIDTLAECAVTDAKLQRILTSRNVMNTRQDAEIAYLRTVSEYQIRLLHRMYIKVVKENPPEPPSEMLRLEQPVSLDPTDPPMRRTGP